MRDMKESKLSQALPIRMAKMTLMGKYIRIENEYKDKIRYVKE